jgi:hypothetical protein
MRERESDEFCATVIPSSLSADERNVVRQALAGMLWSKQFYYYDVDRWLEEHDADPFRADRHTAPRNAHWHHMYNADIISMPDKMGISLVLGLGLGISHFASNARRPGFWQAAVGPDSTGQLFTSQRPTTRVRVELRRCQPAGSRVVNHLYIPSRNGQARQRGHRVAGTQLSETAP